MRRLNKVLALILAVVMLLAMSAVALAADGDFMGADGPETTITATNVTAGDSVAYYQLVAYDASSTTGWVLTDLGESCGVTLANLIDGITAEEAATIANALSSASATGNMAPKAEGSTTYEATVAAGLYYLKATAAGDTVIYNPAFVSADYYEGGNTVDFSTAFESSTVLKKSEVTLTKEVTGEDKFKDTKPGDVIPYKITTAIPSYSGTFEHPVFTISDSFSAGLTLSGNITVTYGESSTTATNDDVIITPDTADGGGFTVAFTEEYLIGLEGATPAVTVEYSAEVTTAAEKNVNPLDNTATLTYSNTPDSTKDQEAITRHYTFTIDGDLLGGTGPSSELIKVGVDKDGNPIEETKETIHGTEVSPLDGAMFLLTGEGLPAEGITAESKDGGHIIFKGLDAGTYTLVETEAPAGYFKDITEFTVEIVPTYDTEVPDLLVSYEVIVTSDTATKTATFTMTNEGETLKSTGSSVESDAAFIQNKQGTVLPSTGGMGTQIFYIAGVVLLLGAGVVLVSRRKTDLD